MGFIFGLIIFAADLYAIFQTLQSPAPSTTKLLWTLVILLLPVLGLVLWFFLGPKVAKV
ncbi:hypothetical protein DESUT3_19680 [Desulfuromonas versatilis]|uniref:Cardiolipin synthase N-terminal domain-containing protein n=1 Tax=Desulfuromonas versatilis TaxID=2802975 RepID=A0ABM8HSG7_9BACT|nr:PLDc N-terminal domain-containing protein [Desulfuromonas versatilis]BCR04899.1 hypothetical protein DESUT3_19680 [Desulfuromonas versatilis]